jgi:hypothetical protein
LCVVQNCSGTILVLETGLYETVACMYGGSSNITAPVKKKVLPVSEDRTTRKIRRLPVLEKLSAELHFVQYFFCCHLTVCFVIVHFFLARNVVFEG